jgi:hypothetical protein
MNRLPKHLGHTVNRTPFSGRRESKIDATAAVVHERGRFGHNAGTIYRNRRSGITQH